VLLARKIDACNTCHIFPYLGGCAAACELFDF